MSGNRRAASKNKAQNNIRMEKWKFSGGRGCGIFRGWKNFFAVGDASSRELCSKYLDFNCGTGLALKIRQMEEIK